MLSQKQVPTYHSAHTPPPYPGSRLREMFLVQGQTRGTCWCPQGNPPPAAGEGASAELSTARVKQAASCRTSGEVINRTRAGLLLGFRSQGCLILGNVSSSSEKSGATADGMIPRKTTGTGKVTLHFSHPYYVTLVKYDTTPSERSDGVDAECQYLQVINVQGLGHVI